jgi:glycosyltransferase involved in cell wall biosynthesis
MKVYNLIENLDNTYGGPAKSVPYMSKCLNDLGVESLLLSIKYSDCENNSVISKYALNWKRFNYNYFKIFRISNTLRKYLSKEFSHNNDEVIIHSHNLWNYIPYLAHKTSVDFKVPLVVSLRGSVTLDKLQKRLAWFFFQKRILSKASLIHVTKPEDIYVLRDYDIKTPIALIPNGININEFNNYKSKNICKANLNLDTDKQYILFMSRIHPRKGLDYLVNAWIKIAKLKNNWDLLIVGPVYNKKYNENILKKIKINNLSHRVHVKGLLDGQERLDAFAASSLFVLPTHSENFGIAIAEAMASKLPVITTHGTPWQDLEIHNAGWWVKLEEKNIDNSLHEAVNLEEEKLKEKGLNGYELIKKYEWKYQADKMKNVYEYVLNKSEKPNYLYEY